MTTVEHKRGNVLVRAALALFLFKIFVLALSLATRSLLPEYFNENAYYGNFHWPRQQAPTQATRLATWDAQHYLFLATEGYHAGQRSITFFPLFPWLIRLTAALPGIGPLGAALLIANALSVAAVLLLHQLIEHRHPGTAADSLLLLLAFPGALFFHFPYTESLFLFLAVAVAWAVARERWLLAAVPAFLIPLTRPNGVLIGLLLLYAAVAHWRRERRISLGPMIALAAPALGFGAYLLFMLAATGNALAGLDMQ
ncbi:MAG TPA: mannosyltransferase family protein, partial [Thermoanaerobaculia bacterium]|nr:mannosyltransferase family protein [Thermoanaerobaculia bacterium]